MTYTPPTEVEKELDRYANGCANCNAGFYVPYTNAKRLIEQIRLSDLDAIIEWIENIKIVENPDKPLTKEYRVVYSNALKDVLSYLKSLKQ